MVKAITDCRNLSCSIDVRTIFVTNTTSPAHDQITAEDYFTNDDIYTYYAADCNTMFPCPTKLFICLKDINQTRRAIVAGEKQAAVEATTYAILNNIMEFNPDTWTERQGLPARRFAVQIGRIYQRVTGLYTLLTLAEYAQITFGPAHRVATAKSALDMIYQLHEDVGPHICLGWPLVVIGVALAGSPPADLARVDKLLDAVSHNCNASCGMYRTLECLRAFWESGKTRWEDCFTEWQATVP